ncbi:MAG TPA: tetratricopeptide repeat protein [Blastocatellia bacterium]|nr:tetratricopeptide repeat protein [Blastocatellia bacterium]
MTERKTLPARVLIVLLLCLNVSAARAQAPDRAGSPSGPKNQQTEGAALAELRRAVETAAGQPAKLRVARFAYAQALSQAGRDDEAAAQYETIIRENNGRDPIAYYNLGNAWARAGQNQKAAEAYARAVEQRAGHYARAHNNLGIVLARLGRVDEAREAYLKAIAEEKGSFADAHHNVALLYWQQGDLKRAEDEVTAALRINPRHEEARLLSEQLKFNHNSESNESEIIVAAGVKANPANSKPVVTVSADTFKLLQQARTVRDRGDLVRAATVYQSAIQGEGNAVPAIEWELADIWMRLDKSREAEEAYRRVIAQAGDRYPMAYYNAGRAMMKQQKYGAAVVMLRQALARVGEAPYIYLALSESLERLDEFEGAIQALEKYNQVRPAKGEDREERDWYASRLASLNKKKNTENKSR